MSVLIFRRKLLDESRVMESSSLGPGHYTPKSDSGQLGHELNRLAAGRWPGKSGVYLLFHLSAWFCKAAGREKRF